MIAVLKGAIGIAAAGMALVSCSTDGKDEVLWAVENKAANDGKIIAVRGLLKADKGYYSLYSADRKECIGLLFTDRQRQSYGPMIGRKVVATGQLKAEGCGRDGVCVEQLCGPTIMTNVSASPAR